MGPDAVWLFRVVFQLAFAIVAGVACVGVWRWSDRIWRPLGVVLGLGILARAWSGLLLFAISYFNLPIVESLHSGDGFWKLAPDARVYYAIAANAAGGAPIPDSSPSPSFLDALSTWFRAAGDGPASPILFNLVLYVAVAALLVAAARPVADSATRRALLIALAAFSFSPVLILVGTQPLKDVFSALLSVVATLSVMSLVGAFSASTRKAIGMTLAVALAVYLMAGVRAYYAIFMWVAAAVSIAVAVLRLPRPLAVRRTPLACGALVLLWCAFMWGAGPYYTYYGDAVTRSLGVHLPLISPSARELSQLPRSETSGMDAAFSTVRVLRQGFIRSGGATNLAGDPQPERGGFDDAKALMVGLAALLLPITALEQLGIVDISGGRGFAFIMEADTIFMTVSLLAIGWVLLTSGRSIRRQLPFTCFALVLSIVTALLMAYVVTNYGILFRLRLLVTVPLWILPLGVSHVAAEARQREESLRALRTTHEAAPQTPERAHSPGAA